jgi:two-component system sensor histidine kinase TctE
MAWWLAPALALLLIVSGWVSYSIANRAVQLAYDHSLVSAAADLAEHVQIQGDSVRFNLPPETEALMRSDDDDKVYFAVRIQDGSFIGGDEDLPMVSVNEGSDRSQPIEFRHQRVHILSRVFEKGRIPIVVSIAETSNQRDLLTWQIIIATLAVQGMVVVLAAITVLLGIARGLRPLQTLEREVSKRSQDDLSTIPYPDVPQESHNFVQALNALLSRLATAYAEQQRFIADAAHQLRTPLAMIQTQLDALEHLPARDISAQTELIKASVAQTIRVANQLLSLARIESHVGRRLQIRRADLAQIAQENVNLWIQMAGERSIDLGFDLQAAVVTCDRFLVREAMSNLVDNALRYTPVGGVVNVSTRMDRGLAQFSVGDSGPGIPDEFRQKVFERFFRIPDTPGDGTGLGLAIVDTIVRAHGANITIDTPPNSGAMISLHFNAAK